MRIQIIVSGLALAVGGLLSNHLAEATTRGPVVNASGACQSALPTFDGLIRKRPTAVSNEGTSPAFVSCSLYGDRYGNDFFGITAYFTNRNQAATTIACTMVNGYKVNGLPAPLLLTKNVVVAANDSGFLSFDATDNGGSNYASPAFNLSCQLPVGTEIDVLFSAYTDDSADGP